MPSPTRPTVALPTAVFLTASFLVLARPAGADDRFAQLGPLLPTPTETRLASGAPGPDYWQQRVDYDIDVTLDAAADAIRGRETVTYHNRSPHRLDYLWLELGPNRFSPKAAAHLASVGGGLDGTIDVDRLNRLVVRERFDGAMNIGPVTAGGEPLRHAVVEGLLRVVPPEPIEPGAGFVFDLMWSYAINDCRTHPGRTGFETLDDGEKIFAIAQWFPRACAYTDYGGWQVKGFLSRGEFTLEFGDYDVRITAPADHVVYGTGEHANADEVLTEPQRARLEEAAGSPLPVAIVTAEEADANREADPTRETKTWRFTAENVRDFAFASSRTFAWDACVTEIDGRDVLCQSLYPHEGAPLWDRDAARAVRHAVEVYSEVTGIPYPYPHATAVLGVVGGGMEYPMICFNGPRPEKDGTYGPWPRRGVVAILIHEVGHNWFPMIVNNDERQWMWLDEGLNSFVENIAYRRWQEPKGPLRSDPHALRDYQKRDKKRPVMTQADSLYAVGSNAYAKPAVGLTILRETILGRENFDFAFKTYCRRWAHKRPEPADLFRTFEDAAGVDLDWFWRGWFYTTDYCDWSIDAVFARPLRRGDPVETAADARARRAEDNVSLTARRDADVPTVLDAEPNLVDFYDSYDEDAVTPEKVEEYREFLERLTPDESRLLGDAPRIYEVTVRNGGRLVMPLILELHFTDGTTATRRYPAEVWRQSEETVTRVVLCDRDLAAVVVDPHNETCDVDLANNRFPPMIDSRNLNIEKPEEPEIDNPLRRSLDKEAEAAEESNDKENPRPDGPDGD